MSLRRVVLGSGLLLLVISAAERVNASTGEVEAVGYGGHTTGGWICGPVGGAKYAGGAVRARVREHERTEQQKGAGTGEVGIAVEHERSRVLNCEGESPPDPCEPPIDLPDRKHFGARAVGGYEWKHVGVEGGVVTWSGIDEEGNRSATAAPDVALKAGKLGKAEAVIGFGSPTATTIRRPGAYVGVRAEPGSGVELEGYFGVFRAGPSKFDDGAARGDVILRVPISDDVKLRAGGALAEPAAGTVDWEASAGVQAGF